MKTELTTEQSQHLIELGVPRESASSNFSYCSNHKHTIILYQIFTITDLLEILPKEIEIKVFNQYNEEDNCKAYIYQEWIGKYEVGYKVPTLTFTMVNYINRFRSDELIDALYELALWCIENGYLKFE